MKDSGKYTGTKVILAQDTVLSVLASLLSILFVRWLSDAIPGFMLIVTKWLAASVAGSLAGILISGSWRIVRRFYTVRGTAKNLLSIVIKEAFLILALLTGLVSLPSTIFCVVAILADFLLSCGLLLYIRMATQILTPASTEKVKAMSSRKNALVAGTGLSSIRLADSIEGDGEFNVAGFVSTDPSLSGRVIADRIVYYCEGMDRIEMLHWKVGGVDAVFFPRDLDKSSFEGSKAEESPEGQGLGDADTEIHIVQHRDGMSVTGLALKRAFDVSLSGVLIVVFSPLLAICAIAVKMEDGGPVFFRQERIGRDGKPFEIIKLRSMRTDAEADGKAALFQGDEDSRLTKTGRFLRSHHLDELPQLYNVFRGDMSFIGHRPERRFYIDQIMACDPRYRFLYQIRPGVTSYATLYNGYTDTLDKMLTRLDLDLYYLRNRSVWFDVKVLGLTFLSIISGKKF